MTSNASTSLPIVEQDPCCGTTEAAAQADACCAPAAKDEAVAAGDACCAPAPQATTDTEEAGCCAPAGTTDEVLPTPAARPQPASRRSCRSW
jgi:hypothetical protein